MRKFILLITLATFAFTSQSYSAERRSKSMQSKEVTVSSIKELKPYLRMDSVTVTMTPGVYRITADDVKSGKFPRNTEVREGQITHALILLEGNNSTYNMEGVTIEVETGVPSAFEGSKYFEVAELHYIGNYNVVKGLTLVNVGSIHQNPRFGWCNVVMDGISNRAEGIEVRSCGSMPYGYGEVFGKGSGAKISHRKHSSWLVRGDDNYVKDCRIIQRSYGHYLFIQGAVGVTIEGCYIEGDMVSTEQILAEKGTGSKADKVGFETVFGYKLPEGYTLSTGEDGIRTYGDGTTYINGKSIKRRTEGAIVIKDCVVKHARSGISLTLGGGTRYVENCTLIGCQDGYSINNGGKIVNCRADAEFGPALRFVSDRDRDAEIDITIIPYEGERKFSGNGSKHLAHIFGSGHNITLRKGKGLKVEQGMCIAVGGDSYTIGNLAKQENYKATNVTLTNETDYPIVIDDNATNVKIVTGRGVDISDSGANSSIKIK
ncbi:MAG: hypothetical protein SNG10_01335 [Rikenellaceae bacterium]